MNLGVIEMRRGDFAVGARRLPRGAAPVHDAAQQHEPRSRALYNLAISRRERGDLEAAGALYRETASLAEQLGADDIAIGAHAGAGLTALRQHDVAAARTALAAAQRMLGARDDWWFQGRERLEALVIRLAMLDGSDDDRARALPRRAREARADGRLRRGVAASRDCGAELATEDPAIWAIVERFAEHATVQQFVPLAARFTALRDIANRLGASRQRSSAPSRRAKRPTTDHCAGVGWCAALPNRSAAHRGSPTAPRRRRRAGAARGASRSPRGFTRFMSRTTNSPRSGSIQIDVPVKPVWPKLRGEK